MVEIDACYFWCYAIFVLRLRTLRRRNHLINASQLRALPQNGALFCWVREGVILVYAYNEGLYAERLLKRGAAAKRGAFYFYDPRESKKIELVI